MRGMMGSMFGDMGDDEMPFHPMMMEEMMFMMDEMMHMAHHMTRGAYRERTENGETVKDYDSGMLVMQEMLYQSVKRVVDNSEDINTIRINGDHVLSFAIENSWNDLVEQLINKGATLKNVNSERLLERAFSNEKLLDKLLKNGLELDEKILVMAIKHERPDMVDLILGRGVNIGVETANYFSNSLNCSKFESFKKLVEGHNLDIQFKNEHDSTFLHRLCLNQVKNDQHQSSIDAAKFLLESGIDINHKNKSDYTALDSLFDYFEPNKVSLATFLVEKGIEVKDVNLALYRLAGQNKIDEASIKLFDVILKSYKGIDNDKLVGNLLGYLGRNDGVENLISCAMNNGVTFADEHYANLIDHTIKAKLNIDDISGIKERLDLLAQIDDKIKNIIANSNGLLLVSHKLTKGKAPLIEYLLEQNVDPNKQDEKGNTPLMLVVKSGKLNEEAITALLKHGADPTIENDSGDSPMNISRAAKALIKDIQESLAQEADSDMSM